MAVRAEPVGLGGDEAAAAEHLRAASDRILAECGKVIVGQQDVLEQLLIALLGQGHCLLVGVPGLAKTLMIRTLADSMNLTFNRVQFTPDLMPSDITGTEMLQEDRATGQRAFRFLHGPIFANVVLADEINRTPPKTQAALLEAMQERQVTVAGNAAPAAGPVLRAGDAEPDRAGRHLPAARGPAGPVHVHHHGGLPERGGRVPHHRVDDLRGAAAGRARGRPATSCWRCRRSCEGAGGRVRDPLRAEARAADAARTARTASRRTRTCRTS